MTLYQNLHKKGTCAHVTRQATIVIPGLGEIPIPRRMTVEKAMQSVAYVARNYPGLGYFVEAIQGHTPPQGCYWLFRVNGNLAKHGISEQFVNPGDRVEWFQSDVPTISRG